jgi:uncharacterized protein (TIGR02996 family)
MDDASFLRAVCWSPLDDGPRLVWADALDERGEAARAEFIRTQCELEKWVHGDHPCPDPERHEMLRLRERELWLANWEPWTEGVRSALRPLSYGPDSCTLPDLSQARWEFRRGFVEEVTMTCQQFFGDPCGRCNGGLWRCEFESSDGYCPACRGTGRVEGLAAALFRAAPVTEVRLSDKRPDRVSNSWCWWRPSEACADCHHLPHEVYDLLPDDGPLYDTEADALSALSVACVAAGRNRLAFTVQAFPSYSLPNVTNRRATHFVPFRYPCD